MSDEGDTSCPLCAEVMDLTDRQLKPCKCGYEICIWCWHHIMDMAAKDGTEGRCPACRTPYDKEKIVGTATKCERLITDTGFEKKGKSQKTRAKSTEGRKNLNNVRVIQRNLVYVVGLPLNLGDEDLLQRKEYFSKYGRVLKVSLSRTAASAIQQFPNNTCSVYITYSKEEEAIRCIQSVHGFVLEGGALKACFGTTKYCHAWLRNLSCGNPDCLYLHEMGAQEDSFTKDEVVSAYTRRINQITGARINMQHCHGHVLPPPSDEKNMHISSTAIKPSVKVESKIPSGVVEHSPRYRSSSRPAALPPGAAWAMQAQDGQQHAPNAVSSNGIVKQIPDSLVGSEELSPTITISTKKCNVLHSGSEKVLDSGEQRQRFQKENQLVSTASQPVSIDADVSAYEKQSAEDGRYSALWWRSSRKSTGSTAATLRNMISDGFTEQVSGFDLEKNANDGEVEDLCYEIVSDSIYSRPMSEHMGAVRSNNYPSDQISSRLLEKPNIPPYQVDHSRSKLSSSVGRDWSGSSNDTLNKQCGQRSSFLAAQVSATSPELDGDVRLFNSLRLKDSKITAHSFANLSNSYNSQFRKGNSLYHSEDFGSTSFDSDRSFVKRKASDVSLSSLPSSLGFASDYTGKSVSQSTCQDGAVENSNFLPCFMNGMQYSTLDMGENSIISSILSMDLGDDGSLASPQNLAKLLGEADKQHGILKLSNSWKAQGKQSRFSFARQEEPRACEELPSSLSAIRELKNSTFENNIHCSKELVLDKIGYSDVSIFTESDRFSETCGSQIITPSSLSANASPTSAPPGFSLPSRLPPSDFSSKDKTENILDAYSGTGSTVLEMPHSGISSLASSNGDVSVTGDIKFMDPAILAVGKGRFPPGYDDQSLDIQADFTHIRAAQNIASLQLLMQRSPSSQQNLGFSDAWSGYSHHTDACSLHLLQTEQSQKGNYFPYGQPIHQQSRDSTFSNGHWDRWNDESRA